MTGFRGVQSASVHNHSHGGRAEGPAGDGRGRNRRRPTIGSWWWGDRSESGRSAEAVQHDPDGIALIREINAAIDSAQAVIDAYRERGKVNLELALVDLQIARQKLERLSSGPTTTAENVGDPQRLPEAVADG